MATQRNNNSNDINISKLGYVLQEAIEYANDNNIYIKKKYKNTTSIEKDTINNFMQTLKMHILIANHIKHTNNFINCACNNILTENVLKFMDVDIKNTNSNSTIIKKYIYIDEDRHMICNYCGKHKIYTHKFSSCEHIICTNCVCKSILQKYNKIHQNINQHQ